MFSKAFLILAICAFFQVTARSEKLSSRAEKAIDVNSLKPAGYTQPKAGEPIAQVVSRNKYHHHHHHGNYYHRERALPTSDVKAPANLKTPNGNASIISRKHGHHRGHYHRLRSLSNSEANLTSNAESALGNVSTISRNYGYRHYGHYYQKRELPAKEKDNKKIASTGKALTVSRTHGYHKHGHYHRKRAAPAQKASKGSKANKASGNLSEKKKVSRAVAENLSNVTLASTKKPVDTNATMGPVKSRATQSYHKSEGYGYNNYERSQRYGRENYGYKKEW